MKHLLLILLASLTLTGCGLFSQNVEVDGERIEVVADSPKEVILVAQNEVNELSLLLKRLATTNTLPAGEVVQAATTLKEANTALRNALDAFEIAGDPTQAESFLTAAEISLSVVLSLLADYLPEE